MARRKKKSTKAKRIVRSELHKFKTGTLKSGSGRKVRSRKQAIAIALNVMRKKTHKKRRRG